MAQQFSRRIFTSTEGRHVRKGLLELVQAEDLNGFARESAVRLVPKEFVLSFYNPIKSSEESGRAEESWSRESGGESGSRDAMHDSCEASPCELKN